MKNESVERSRHEFQQLASLRAAVLVGCSLIATGGLRAEQKESIALSATAAPAYVRPVDASGKPKAETYVFSQGKHFGGQLSDASLAQVKFADVLKAVVPALAKQNYLPTKDEPNADLIIAVHWGTTISFETPGGADRAVEQKNQALATLNTAIADNGIGDPGALNLVLAEGEAGQQSQADTINFNADLLGYRRTLEKERLKLVPGTEEYTMSTELNEERYFVVLVAFDYQKIKKEHQPRLLWVTRMSVRSPGNNFIEALPALALAGSDVFGRQLNDLVRVKVPIQRGTVKLHELEILGTAENAQPDKPAGKAKPQDSQHP